MPLTPAAKRWCAEMSEYYPEKIEDWQRKAAIIAQAQGKSRIGKLDLDSAMMVAGDEFLPCQDEEVSQV